MMPDAPAARDARLVILLAGSLTPPGVVSTCSLIRSGDVVAVVDPGMANRQTDTDGIAVLTHLWCNADGPEEDPVAEDRDALHASRKRVLAFADLIVPGHGAPFEAYHLRHG